MKKNESIVNLNHEIIRNKLIGENSSVLENLLKFNNVNLTFYIYDILNKIYLEDDLTDLDWLKFYNYNTVKNLLVYYNLNTKLIMKNIINDYKKKIELLKNKKNEIINVEFFGVDFNNDASFIIKINDDNYNKIKNNFKNFFLFYSLFLIFYLYFNKKIKF